MNQTRSRLKFILLLILFSAPLLIAAIIYYFGFAPERRSNHGMLVTAVALGEFSSPRLDGPPFDSTALRQKWSVVHLLGAQCGADCERSLYHTRQVRIALGRGADRVQRVFLSPNRDLLQRLAIEHPDAILLPETAGGLETHLAPLLREHGLGVPAAGLVDPLGNLMMGIPLEMDPSLLLKDLKRLLRLSRIG